MSSRTKRAIMIVSGIILVILGFSTEINKDQIFFLPLPEPVVGRARGAIHLLVIILGVWLLLKRNKNPSTTQISRAVLYIVSLGAIVLGWSIAATGGGELEVFHSDGYSVTGAFVMSMGALGIGYLTTSAMYMQKTEPKRTAKGKK